MPADEALDHTVMGETVEALVPAVAGGGGKDEAEIAWFSRFEEPLLNGADDCIRRADSDEAGACDGITRPDDGNGISG